MSDNFEFYQQDYLESTITLKLIKNELHIEVIKNNQFYKGIIMAKTIKQKIDGELAHDFVALYQKSIKELYHDLVRIYELLENPTAYFMVVNNIDMKYAENSVTMLYSFYPTPVANLVSLSFTLNKHGFIMDDGILIVTPISYDIIKLEYRKDSATYHTHITTKAIKKILKSDDHVTYEIFTDPSNKPKLDYIESNDFYFFSINHKGEHLLFNLEYHPDWQKMYFEERKTNEYLEEKSGELLRELNLK